MAVKTEMFMCQKNKTYKTAGTHSARDQAVHLKSVGSSSESKLTQQRSSAKAGKSPLTSIISSEYLILDYKYPREDLCNKDQFHS